ncbi:DUF6049 family protein [Microbacterium sp.]|uniref:DUF6049 family protein n=1 Tax=Microbacterium sp. TaxID=51671 RepID=UPI0025EBAF48|nr:DUF6049 family protein [Microbacterium sp.]
MTSSAATPARRRRVRLALLSALVLAAAPAATAGAADDPLTSPGVTFVATPTGDAVLAEGQPLTLALHAENATGTPVASGSVSIAVTDTALSTREALREWLADATPDAAAREIGTAVIGELDPFAQRTEMATVDPDATGLRQLPPGVYPLTATYVSERGDLTAGSVLVVPDAAASASVGVIVPITTPARSVGLLTSDELAAAVGPGGDLRAQLDAVTGTAAILAVDPAIVASIRVLGSSAPASARTWLGELMSLPNTRFALQFGDADLATQFGAGLSAPLTVTTLDPAMSASDFSASTPASPPPTPLPTPSPTTDPESALPALEVLMDIGSARDGLYWPATGTAGAATAAAVAALGSDAAPAVALVPSSVAAGSTSGRANAGVAQLIVYDADVSSALRSVSVASGTVDRARARAAASAFTALANAQSPGAGLLVTIDRGADRSAAALRDAVGAAYSLPGRTPAGLDAFLDAAPSAVTLSDVAADPGRVTALTELLTDEAALGAFSSILTDPSVLTGPERTSILQLIGNAWLPDADEFADGVTGHRATTRSTLNAVALIPPSGLTLAASSASLGFTIRNDLPWPVSLVVMTTPNDPRVIVQNATPVEVGAQQNSRAEVPIEARVGSGESNLTVQVRSPSMVAIGDPVSVDVSVRAEWESVGIIVLVSLVAAMLILGVIRTIVRRRAGAAAESADG